MEPCHQDTTLIRHLSPEDAASAAALSHELGYPVTIETMEKRLTKYANATDHAVFGAYAYENSVNPSADALADQYSLIAWIDVGIVAHLQSGQYGEIGGLIVSRAHQGLGIGRQLLQTAERWVLSRGLKTILVRSQISRETAHAFYLKQNFQRVKTSAVFQKTLRQIAE